MITLHLIGHENLYIYVEIRNLNVMTLESYHCSQVQIMIVKCVGFDNT